MKVTELRVNRLKRKLSKLELPTTDTKNEQLQLQGIDLESYEFEEEEERELQTPASSSGVDINSLLDVASIAIVADGKNGISKPKVI